MVGGWVAPGFEPLRDAFAENLAGGGELGAAFAVTLDGEPVADLWGGVADGATGRAWERDTLVGIFSGTKALVATCLLVLADRGALDLDAPVRRYWPEFAACGKHELRVLQLASHTARLPGLGRRVGLDAVVDDRAMATLLAAQPQDDDPRAGSVYHALTYGWLCGELIRRVDGRSAGRFFAEEVAGPLALEIWLGLPPEPAPRVAALRYGPGWEEAPIFDPVAVRRDALLRRVWHNPSFLGPGTLPWNRPDWHAAEIPGAGAIASARSVARLFGCLARGGELDGVRLLRPATLERARRERSRFHEPLLDEPMAYGIGFQLQTGRRPFGPPADAFGHGGAGGSVHCAWPSQRAGISYAMNLLRNDHQVDPRPQRLLAALHDVLA